MEALDSKRLGKQRVESKQILTALESGKGWIHHPATKMWRGHENALKLYLNVSIEVWVERGYNNTMELEKIDGNIITPDWLGYEKYHASHRSNLLRKEPDFYGQYDWDDNPSDFYCWYDVEKSQWYYQERGKPKRLYID